MEVSRRTPTTSLECALVHIMGGLLRAPGIGDNSQGVAALLFRKFPQDGRLPCARLTNELDKATSLLSL